MDSVDFRSGPRIAASVPVALRFPDGHPPEGWGRMMDLSAAGMKVETRWPLKVGQPVYLSFAPRSPLRLENLRARVVRVGWEDGYYIGGLVFDESVDQAYLKETLIALMTE
jgi:hypothetical protein